MSSFTTPLRVEILNDLDKGGRIRACVLSPFEFYSDHGATVIVPVGFVTNFASVPRALWGIAPPFGPWAKSAVVHDFLYLTQPCDRATADLMFLEGMDVLNVDRKLSRSIWGAVRLFGGPTWQRLTPTA